MPHPVRKHYLPGSPGARRKEIGLTLSSIKRELRGLIKPGEYRHRLREQGLLGPVRA